jgi:hypothetical protein
MGENSEVATRGFEGLWEVGGEVETEDFRSAGSERARGNGYCAGDLVKK